jgi:hypothetical protein
MVSLFTFILGAHGRSVKRRMSAISSSPQTDPLLGCIPESLVIGSGAGDCAPAPSHTTGRAVFRIRRLNAAAFYMAAARSDGMTNPQRRNTVLLSAVCKPGLAAIRHAPRPLCATFARRSLSPS